MKEVNKKVFVGARINARLVELIEKYTDKYKTNKTQIIESALIEYFKNKNEDIF